MTVDSLLVLLDACVIGLAAVLTAISLSAAYRYREMRFVCVGIALAIMGLLGLGGLLNALWSGFDAGLALGWVSAVLLLFSEIFLYLSLMVPYSKKASPEAP